MINNVCAVMGNLFNSRSCRNLWDCVSSSIYIGLLVIVSVGSGLVHPCEVKAQFEFEHIPKLASEVYHEPSAVRYFEAYGMRYTGGEYYNNAIVPFRLHTPDEIEDGKRYPLFIWFHGSGERGSDNLSQLRNLNLLKRYFISEKFFMLAPQVPVITADNDWVSLSAYMFPRATAIDESRYAVTEEVVKDIKDCPCYITKKIVDRLLREYPVDRVFLFGFSAGCNAVSEFLKFDDIPVKGAVFIGGQPSVGTPVRDCVIIAVYGRDDKVIDEPRILRYVKDCGKNAKAIKIEDTPGNKHDEYIPVLTGRLDIIETFLKIK